jgi:deoxyribodipyrimidine photo-lyase
MPGERGAQKRFQELDRSFADAYPDGRDFPSHAATSRLSPHLHFGEVGPNRIHECLLRIKGAATTEATQDGVDALRRQLGWRDFTYHLLHHFPHTPDEPLRPEFDRVEWRHDSEALAAWVRGRTGYPIVDAGMRELAETGWMHNRVRMIVGSFLTKDLLIDWREGAMVFWDRLVDADLANNTFGWQWAAGCGADAAPYFRIFNPTTQAKRFDPDGAYVRRWIPELDRLPIKYLHDPWNAPSEVLRSAGIELGREYPGPIVDHAEARKRALEAFAVLKSS